MTNSLKLIWAVLGGLLVLGLITLAFWGAPVPSAPVVKVLSPQQYLQSAP